MICNHTQTRTEATTSGPGLVMVSFEGADASLPFQNHAVAVANGSCTALKVLLSNSLSCPPSQWITRSATAK